MKWPLGIRPAAARAALIPAALAVGIPLYVYNHLDQSQCEAGSDVVRAVRALSQQRLTQLYADALRLGNGLPALPEFGDWSVESPQPGWVVIHLRHCGSTVVYLEVTKRGEGGERIDLVFGHHTTDETETLWRK